MRILSSRLMEVRFVKQTQPLLEALLKIRLTCLPAPEEGSDHVHGNA